MLCSKLNIGLSFTLNRLLCLTCICLELCLILDFDLILDYGVLLSVLFDLYKVGYKFDANGIITKIIIAGAITIHIVSNLNCIETIHKTK